MLCLSLPSILLHQVHSNLRSYVEQDGVDSYRQECDLVGGEVQTLKEDLALQINQLCEEVSG